MASEVVTLALDGAPTLNEYVRALGSWRVVLEQLAEQIGAAAEIDWVVESLDTASAITTLRGEAEDRTAVQRVAEGYLEIGYAYYSGDVERIERIGEPARAAMREMLGVINGRVPSIRFETAEDDVTLSSEPPSAALRPVLPVVQIPGAYGAVTGRIQTLSNRSSLRFTLYDTVHDRPVGCYLQEGQQELMPDLFDRLAVVEGWIRRDAATGRPTTVRRIRRITPIEPLAEDAWRGAQGVLADAQLPPAEAVIRDLRDAQ